MGGSDPTLGESIEQVDATELENKASRAVRCTIGERTAEGVDAPRHTGRVAHIVQAKTEDAEALGRFQTRCWEQTYRGIAPDEFLDATTAQIRVDRWVERIAGGSRRVLMALSDDELLIGVASTARADRTADGLPVLELCTLYVDERAQGTGVAGRLLEAALGDEDAHLLVFSVNARAQHFYAKHGFRPCGDSQSDLGTGLDEQRWIRRARPPASSR